MKKKIAILLVLVSVCTLIAAAAQDIEILKENELFYMAVTLPGDARVESSMADENISLTVIGFVTPGKPAVEITVAADELYAGRNLSSLPQEDVQRIISGITIEMSNPKTEIRVSPGGYTYIVANEQKDQNDTCDTMMLVNGYFIMVKVYYPDLSTLTQQDETIGPAIVETFRFVGNTNS